MNTKEKDQLKNAFLMMLGMPNSNNDLFVSDKTEEVESTDPIERNFQMLKAVIEMAEAGIDHLNDSERAELKKMKKEYEKADGLIRFYRKTKHLSDVDINDKIEVIDKLSMEIPEEFILSQFEDKNLVNVPIKILRFGLHAKSQQEQMLTFLVINAAKNPENIDHTFDREVSELNKVFAADDFAFLISIVGTQLFLLYKKGNVIYVKYYNTKLFTVNDLLYTSTVTLSTGDDPTDLFSESTGIQYQTDKNEKDSAEDKIYNIDKVLIITLPALLMLLTQPLQDKNNIESKEITKEKLKYVVSMINAANSPDQLDPDLQTMIRLFLENEHCEDCDSTECPAREIYETLKLKKFLNFFKN